MHERGLCNSLPFSDEETRSQLAAGRFGSPQRASGAALTLPPVLGKASRRREEGRDSRRTHHILRWGAEELSQAWGMRRFFGRM